MELIGYYKNDKNENLNKFFKAVGVPAIVRLLVWRSKPTVAILQLEDFWSITVKTRWSSREKSFKLGKEYVEFFPGRAIQNITTMENGKLVTRSTNDMQRTTVTAYELTSDKLTITLRDEKSGVEAKRFFKKIPTKL